MTAKIQNARQMEKSAMNAKKWFTLQAVVLRGKMLRETEVSIVEDRHSETDPEEETSSSDSSIFLIRPVNKVEQTEENNKKIIWTSI